METISLLPMFGLEIVDLYRQCNESYSPAAQIKTMDAAISLRKLVATSPSVQARIPKRRCACAMPPMTFFWARWTTKPASSAAFLCVSATAAGVPLPPLQPPPLQPQHPLPPLPPPPGTTTRRTRTTYYLCVHQRVKSVGAHPGELFFTKTSSFFRHIRHILHISHIRHISHRYIQHIQHIWHIPYICYIWHIAYIWHIFYKIILIFDIYEVFKYMLYNLHIWHVCFIAPALGIGPALQSPSATISSSAGMHGLGTTGQTRVA